ncbi:MAG: protein phosphatase 2C family protein, partial [Tabrizicola sp.]|nr:protein phosphatase 2C family protein [Tabrizicola sp.]
VKPYELKQGDIVVCASDGLQFLSNAQIEKVLSKYRKTRSTEIAERLLEELGRLDDPDQDNISFTIIKVNDASARQKEDVPNRPSMAVSRPRRLTTVAPEHMLVPMPKPAAVPASAPTVAPAATVVRTPRPVVEAVQESNQDQPAEDLSPVRLRPRRVTVIK